MLHSHLKNGLHDIFHHFDSNHSPHPAPHHPAPHHPAPHHPAPHHPAPHPAPHHPAPHPAPHHPAPHPSPVSHWTDHGHVGDPSGILDHIHVTGAGSRTARAEGLRHGGVAASQTIAARDTHRVLDQHNLRHEYESVGQEHHIPPALLAAIASRETHGGSALARNGTGDHGHGYGVMQVDNRHGQHPDRSQGPYGHAHLEQAAGIFDHKLAAVRHQFPHMSPEDQMRTAVSRYNGGRGLPGSRSDVGTTGGDYGNDTIARAQYYAHHWAE